MLEGGPANGKSTQKELLIKYFQNKGKEVFVVEEPSHEGIGGFIREYVLSHKDTDGVTDLLLYYANRIELKRQIQDEIKKGKIVISARNYCSSAIYQTVVGKVPIEKFRVFHIIIKPYILKPDLTIILTMNPKEAIKRRKGSLDKFETPERITAITHGYKKLPRIFIGERFVEVDASGTIEEVYKNVIKAIEAFPNYKRLKSGFWVTR